MSMCRLRAPAHTQVHTHGCITHTHTSCTHIPYIHIYDTHNPAQFKKKKDLSKTSSKILLCIRQQLKITPVCSMVSRKYQIIHVLPSFPFPSFTLFPSSISSFQFENRFYFLISLLCVFVCAHAHAYTAVCTWR